MDFQIENGVLMKYNGKEAHVVIPDGVTKIGEGAFLECGNLQSFTILNSVTEIGKGAFVRCKSLREVVLPGSVKKIGERVFEGCASLESVTISDGVTSIGRWAFYGCNSLREVVLPDSVTAIGTNAFCSCTSLQIVTLGSGVTVISENAFAACRALKAFEVSDGNRCFTAPDGVLVEKKGMILLKYPTGRSQTDYTIPDGVKEIGWYAFCGCTSLQSVTFSADVKKIGNSAFEGCASLQSIVIPEHVNGICCGAFSNCASLKSVVITGGMTWISDRAFDGCKSLQSVTLGSSVTEIGRYVFEGCASLQSITIPDSVTRIGKEAFKSCTSLREVVIGAGVTWIGGHAFFGCSALERFTVADGNPVFASFDGVLYNKQMTALLLCPAGKERVVIPDSVRRIVPAAFRDCKALRSVSIGSGVTAIGKRVFENCASLQSINLPDSVTQIGRYAFYGCERLKSTAVPESVSSPDAPPAGERMYSACIATVTAVRDHPRDARLRCAEIGGHTVFTDDSVNVGQRMVYFPVGGELNKDFARKYSTLTRSKVTRYRGETAEGFALPVEVLRDYTDIDQLQDGDRVSVLNGQEICRLTVPKGLVIDEAYRALRGYYGDSSFSGTVRIPDGITVIRSRVFRWRQGHIHSLIIPDSVKEIESDNVFYEDVVIRGKKGSEAERFAAENGFVFIGEETR